MANKLSAVVDLLWKGNQAASNIDKDFDKIEKSVEQTDQAINKATASTKEFNSTGKATGNGLDDLTKGFAAAGVAIVAVGAAAAKAYEIIGEGAALTAAQGQFENLSASINTTGDAMLGKLKSATKGLVTDAELVAGATTIMNLGLADTEAGTVRMAAAVGALNLDLGVMALTLANDSTARLDSLGLSMENVAKTKRQLQASGFIGDAFDEAVLIELEKKMVLLGDASETTAGQMKIVETAAANLSDELKIMAAVQAGPLIKSLSSAVSGQNKVNEGIAAGVITMKEWNAIVNEAPSILEGTAIASEVVNQRLEEQAEALREAQEYAAEYLYYQQALYGALDDTTEGLFGYTTEQIYANQAQEAANESTENGIRIQAQNAYALEMSAEAAAASAASQAESFGIMAGAADATKASISTLYSEETASAWNASAQIQQANADIITSLKEVSLATIEQKVAQSVAAGEITAAAGVAFLAGTAEGLGLLSEQEAEAQIAVGNASLEMAETLATGLETVQEQGEAVAEQVGLMSGKVAGAIAEDWEATAKEAAEADETVGQVKKSLDAIMAESYDIVINVSYNTTGSPPSGGGASANYSGGDNSIPEFATGGMVPGPIGSPQLILAHGGEQVLTQAQQNQRGGNGITQNFYSNTREAQALAWAQAEQMRRGRMDTQ